MSERTFGRGFAEWRASHGLSRSDLAEKASTSTSYAHYVENDETLPSVEKLEQIGSAFGCDTQNLVDLRNEIHFEREGLDGAVASGLHRLGKLELSEREELMNLVEKLLAARK